VPAAAFLYVRVRRRRDAAPVRLETTAAADPSALDAFMRVAPPFLMLLALALLVFAVSRPQASLALPAHSRTVMLAMDVSGSMRAGDVKPDRITAARNAAHEFIESLPDDARIGLVSMAASASVAQSPTAKRSELFEALERFQLQRGTALGSGIVLALSTLLPEARIDAERHINGYSGRYSAVEAKPVPPASNSAVAIVVVSDGQSNMGPDPIKMARLAADHGVRVHTVGIGTTEGAVLNAKGMAMRVRLDETVLKEIATVTQGEYFQAGSASELKRVYSALSSKISMEKKRPVEITAIVAGIGALLAVVGGFIGFIRDGRIL
jgi:Ca-activated chloride channel family protein